MVKKKKHEELDQYDYVDDEYIGETSLDYIEAIGLFVLEFSALEHSINLHVAEKINDRGHFPGYQVIELLSTRDKIDLLARMVGAYLFHSKSKKQKAFADIISKLKELNTFRNKVLHANWMSARKDGTVRTRIVIDEEEGNVLFERMKITPKIIQEKCDECSAVEEQLGEFIEEM